MNNSTTVNNEKNYIHNGGNITFETLILIPNNEVVVSNSLCIVYGNIKIIDQS